MLFLELAAARNPRAATSTAGAGVAFFAICSIPDDLPFLFSSGAAIFCALLLLTTWCEGIFVRDSYGGHRMLLLDFFRGLYGSARRNLAMLHALAHGSASAMGRRGFWRVVTDIFIVCARALPQHPGRVPVRWWHPDGDSTSSPISVWGRSIPNSLEFCHWRTFRSLIADGCGWFACAWKSAGSRQSGIRNQNERPLRLRQHSVVRDHIPSAIGATIQLFIWHSLASYPPHVHVCVHLQTIKEFFVEWASWRARLMPCMKSSLTAYCSPTAVYSHRSRQIPCHDATGLRVLDFLGQCLPTHSPRLVSMSAVPRHFLPVMMLRR